MLTILQQVYGTDLILCVCVRVRCAHVSTKLVELLLLVETVIAQVLFVFTIGTDLPAPPPDNMHRPAKLICGDILRAQL